MSGLIPLTVRELKKWYRNPVFFLVGLIQPIFWIVLFGSAFDITKLLGPAGVSSTLSPFYPAPNYITFIIGGILTTTSLFTGMFAGVNIIWDRRLGPMSRFLVSPISRSSIVFSKVLSSTFRILVQAAILLAAALIIPNGLVLQKGFNLFGVFVIVVALVLIAFSFSSIFSIIAIRLRKMETVFGIINLINLPLIFASFALFPKALMASWLGTVAEYNPVSWSSEAIRTVLLYGNLSSSQTNSVLLYLLYLFLLAAFLVIITYILSEKEIRD